MSVLSTIKTAAPMAFAAAAVALGSAGAQAASKNENTKKLILCYTDAIGKFFDQRLAGKEGTIRENVHPEIMTIYGSQAFFSEVTALLDGYEQKVFDTAQECRVIAAGMEEKDVPPYTPYPVKPTSEAVEAWYKDMDAAYAFDDQHFDSAGLRAEIAKFAHQKAEEAYRKIYGSEPAPHN